jgi:hypothetical protein
MKNVPVNRAVVNCDPVRIVQATGSYRICRCARTLFAAYTVGLCSWADSLMSYGADDSYKIDLQTIGGLQRFFRKCKSLCAITEIVYEHPLCE